MGLKLKRYKTLVGLPSGEIMVVPQKAVGLLFNNGLLWKEAIYDGQHHVVHYVFEDTLIYDIYDTLGEIDQREW